MSCCRATPSSCPNEGKFELPAGAQLTRAKLERPALVTLPSGGQVERVQETPTSVVYRFPPDTEIRFPTNIRWQLATVIALLRRRRFACGARSSARCCRSFFGKMGFDPGYASSPFVATFVDVTGIVIYFSIAHIWLL